MHQRNSKANNNTTPKYVIFADDQTQSTCQNIHPNYFPLLAPVMHKTVDPKPDRGIIRALRPPITPLNFSAPRLLVHCASILALKSPRNRNNYV